MEALASRVAQLELAIQQTNSNVAIVDNAVKTVNDKTEVIMASLDSAKAKIEEVVHFRFLSKNICIFLLWNELFYSLASRTLLFCSPPLTKRNKDWPSEVN